MAYTTLTYLVVFLGITVLIYYLVPLRLRWGVLLAASCIYYLINSLKGFLFLLAAAIAIYLTGLLLNKISDGYQLAKKGLEKEDRKQLKKITDWQKKLALLLVVLFCFGLLVFLKYYNFFGMNANHLLKAFHIPKRMPNFKLLLPLGISFYTLQAISYTVDVYRGKYRATRNFGQLLLFLCFFPQIVEGPIGRYDLLGEQLHQGHRFDWDGFTQGAQRILWGLFKKIVIADRAAALVNTVFDSYADYSGWAVALATLLYTLELYAEFSGCMDIVCGSARLFGISLSENFERPFFSHTVSEFWRRWHITLGAWFRDYLFYPLSLSKGLRNLEKKLQKLGGFFSSLVPTACAMFVVWFSTGIWHGASWKYIAYGLYYFGLMFLGMLLEPLCRKLFPQPFRQSAPYRGFQILRTFLLVNIGMLLFRADSLRIGIHMFLSLFRKEALPFTENIFSLGLDRLDFIVLLAGVAVMLAVSLLEEKKGPVLPRLGKAVLPLRWSVYLLLFSAVVLLGAYGANYAPVDFIYANF